MKPDFSPIPLAKIDKIILMTNYLYKKNANYSDMLTDSCSEWMFFSIIMCNFAVVNPSKGLQNVPDNEKKKLRGFKTVLTVAGRD